MLMYTVVVYSMIHQLSTSEQAYIHDRVVAQGYRNARDTS